MCGILGSQPLGSQLRCSNPVIWPFFDGIRAGYKKRRYLHKNSGNFTPASTNLAVQVYVSISNNIYHRCTFVWVPVALVPRCFKKEGEPWLMFWNSLKYSKGAHVSTRRNLHTARNSIALPPPPTQLPLHRDINVTFLQCSISVLGLERVIPPPQGQALPPYQLPSQGCKPSSQLKAYIIVLHASFRERWRRERNSLERLNKM